MRKDDASSTIRRWRDVAILVLLVSGCLVVLRFAALFVTGPVYSRLLPVMVVVGFLALPFAFIWLTSLVSRRQHRIEQGLCERCGYDLRGTEPGGSYITCPECGCMQARTYKRDDDAET